MNRTILITTLLMIGATPALASGTHSGGHANDKMSIGEPAKTKAKRTIKISMIEKSDGAMLFQPAIIKVRAGETVRLQFVNKGEADHEYVMDENAAVMEHKAVMAKFPEMEHDDPNAIRLAPNASGEILWTFAKSGEFTFACLIPGHYDSGMKGVIQVSD